MAPASPSGPAQVHSHLGIPDAYSDLGEFFQQGARGVAQTGSLHPARQGLPQNVGQKAHQDVGPDAMLFLMPDRSDQELVLGDSKGPLGFGQLDVSFPERHRLDVAQIAPQDVTTLRDARPLIPVLVALPGDLQLRLSHRLGKSLDANGKRSRGPPVLL
ncbi:MAG: hypothetical protein ACLP7Q_04745, partial [Isosphaeraceae bacterium]